jgi:hypothetical protein
MTKQYLAVLSVLNLVSDFVKFPFKLFIPVQKSQ